MKLRALSSFAVALGASALTATAQDLVSGLSQDQIEITSTYAGTEIVVFGASESAQESHEAGAEDVAVAVRGPDASFNVHRKARVGGLWLNRDRIALYGMPAFYYLASTRPLAQFAGSEVRARYQLGVEMLRPARQSTRSRRKAEPFRRAALRIYQHQRLYAEAPGGVEFLGSRLFRARIPIPANAPRGQYTVEVYLFRDGSVVSAETTPLTVNQIGLERRLFNFAHREPLAYGIATVLMAMFLGWASSLIFRKEA